VFWWSYCDFKSGYFRGHRANRLVISLSTRHCACQGEHVFYWQDSAVPGPGVSEDELRREWDGIIKSAMRTAGILNLASMEYRK
jgi:hypothetical protein